MNLEKGEQVTDYKAVEDCFTLKRSEPCMNSRIICVDFSPSLSKQSSKPVCSFPIFNRDGKSYMPSFILPAQGENLKSQEKLYAVLHHRKLLEACEQNEQMYVPKPSKKNSCCCICRVYYEDYLTHVNCPDHVNNMHKSPFNQHIKDFCDAFNSPKRSAPADLKHESEVQKLNERPRKRRKIQKTQKNRKVQGKEKAQKPHQQSIVSTMIDSLGMSNQNNQKTTVQVGV